MFDAEHLFEVREWGARSMGLDCAECRISRRGGCKGHNKTESALT